MPNDPRAAVAACRAGLAVEPDDAEILFREALLLRELGDNAGAETSWRRILGLRPPTKFASVVTGIYGHLTRRNLAAIVEERGARDEALGLWNEILMECPDDPEALRATTRLGHRKFEVDALPRPASLLAAKGPAPDRPHG